ncbi:MAG: TfoX/Sxy family DNA transformation protein [Bdellovibrionota bacterium]|nr:TfoX/Sxy family DNA transformation protein [Bdellovibrionota bacterium]
MIDIENAKNIGPITAAELKNVGVKSLQKLKEIGAEEAFQLVIDQYPERLNFNFLLALSGACNDLDWREIPAKEKESLKIFIKKIKIQFEKGLL